MNSKTNDQVTFQLVPATTPAMRILRNKPQEIRKIKLYESYKKGFLRVQEIYEQEYSKGSLCRN